MDTCVNESKCTDLKIGQEFDFGKNLYWPEARGEKKKKHADSRKAEKSRGTSCKWKVNKMLVMKLKWKYEKYICWQVFWKIPLGNRNADTIQMDYKLDNLRNM